MIEIKYSNYFMIFKYNYNIIT